jgi:hypothetical protein
MERAEPKLLIYMDLLNDNRWFSGIDMAATSGTKEFLYGKSTRTQNRSFL